MATAEQAMLLADSEMPLLIAWLVMTGLALVAIITAIVWAARAGQFKDQDRARYLPLDSDMPDEEE